MPNELQKALEKISAEKGESISTIVRDLVRDVAAGSGRSESPISPPSARAFR
jgi:hypothetical protein